MTAKLSNTTASTVAFDKLLDCDTLISINQVEALRRCGFNSFYVLIEPLDLLPEYVFYALPGTVAVVFEGE